jgi:hypothetical protein
MRAQHAVGPHRTQGISRKRREKKSASMAWAFDHSCKSYNFCDSPMPMRPVSSSLRRAGLTLGGLLVIGTVVALGYSWKITTAADQFLSAVKNGRIGEAHALLATSLRDHKQEEWLRGLLDDTGILDAESVEWSKPTVENGYGELKGEITRAGGEVVKVSMLFVREHLQWRLYAIKRPFEGELPQAIEPPFPDRVQQIALVQRAMHDFTASVQARDMSYFHSTLAPTKRVKVTADKLDAAFERFFDIDEDLTSLDAITPRVAEMGSPTNEGHVTVSGYFPTEPKRVHFEQKYSYEKNDWRLQSFKISMR